MKSHVFEVAFCRFVVVALGACATFSATAAANHWNGETAGGNWSVDANWTAGHAPTAGETLWITNLVSAKGHTVTPDVNCVSTATHALDVGNSTGTATNTLVIKSGTELDFDRAKATGDYWDVQVQKGGRIVMEDGSIVRRRYGDYGEYNSLTGWHHYFVRLTGGGLFEQKGGYLGLSDNSRQGLWIGDSSGNVTSVWRMTGGTFSWSTGKMGTANILHVGKCGRFEVGQRRLHECV